MQRKLHAVFILIAALTGLQFYLILAQRSPFYLNDVVHSVQGRPYVLRILLPLLSCLAEQITGLNAVKWLGIWITFFNVVLYFAVRSLYSSFEPGQTADIVAFVTTELVFVITLENMQIYDMATTMSFALCFALLAQKKYWLFYLVFPVAVLNRETAFLLTIFFFVYGIFHIPRHHLMFGSVYQVIAYVLIRLRIMSMFAHTPGSVFWLTWNHVLSEYGTQTLRTARLLSVVVILLILVFRKWSEKPEFLRIAFFAIFPMQIALHLMLGLPYEIRVFLESIPVLTCLITYRFAERESLKSILHAALVNLNHIMRRNCIITGSQDEKDNM